VDSIANPDLPPPGRVPAARPRQGTGGVVCGSATSADLCWAAERSEQDIRFNQRRVGDVSIGVWCVAVATPLEVIANVRMHSPPIRARCRPA